MGKIKRGILGGFQGKVANVIGQGWKGIDVMRSMPISVANPRTPAQTANRTKFSDLVEVSKAIGSAYLRKTFDKQAIRKTTFNAFVAANMKAQDTYPTWKRKDFVLAGEYSDKAGYNLSAEMQISSGTVTISFSTLTNLYGFVDTDKVSACIINTDGTNTLRASVIIEGAEWSEGTISFRVTNLASLDDCSICLVVTKQADGRNYAFNV